MTSKKGEKSEISNGKENLNFAEGQMVVIWALKFSI